MINNDELTADTGVIAGGGGGGCKMINNDELTADTGVIAGGVSGKQKNDDGTMKFTRAINNNELFVKPRSVYVYPLCTCNKIPFKDLLTIATNEVSDKMPSRLVIGIGFVQLSRIQARLEHFLMPSSRYYDSTDMLIKIENCCGAK